jgi:putative tryptophan/tyrosine transport system substrate-binding protein
MRRREFVGTLALAALAAPRALHAQVKGKPARIGFLSADATSTRAQKAFLQGMQEAGLAEGRDFVVDWRFTEGKYQQLPAFAAELVRAAPDVIVAVTTLCVQAVRQATKSIPIVMVGVPDPIGEGFATSLSRPGGNVTGLSNIVTEVSIKHVELLATAVPKLALVGVLINPANPSDALILEQVQGAAYMRRIKVLPTEAATPAQIEAGIAAIAKARAQAVIVSADAYFGVQRELIARLALGSRLPSISSSRDMTEAGGLMSYGQDMAQHYQRAAMYVGKILRGAAPGGLAIEQPTVLEFVINRRTAQALGLAIPPVLELRADRIVE